MPFTIVKEEPKPDYIITMGKADRYVVKEPPQIEPPKPKRRTRKVEMADKKIEDVDDAKKIYQEDAGKQGPVGDSVPQKPASDEVSLGKDQEEKSNA